MIVAVIDGMGGGIGSQIVSHLRQEMPTSLEIIVLGTNGIATGNMMKAKANRGATGENAIKFSLRDADVIMGPLTIVIPNSMMGEITPEVAEAVSSSKAYKILLPITSSNIELIGIEARPLFLSIKDAIDKLKEYLKK
ncbi:MAG: DUF3842 family protein [bacterium]